MPVDIHGMYAALYAIQVMFDYTFNLILRAGQSPISSDNRLSTVCVIAHVSSRSPQIDTSSDVHPYASVNKTRKTPAASDDPYSMPVDTIAADHDELGYAVVSEEFKRARTMSKEATAMKKIAKKKPSNLSEDPYSTIDSLVTGSSDDPSSPPPVSPIKDDEIIQGFSPPPTPPPLAVSPEGQLSQVSDSCQDDIKQVWKYEGCESGGEILEGNHLTHDPTQKTNGESPCDPVDEGNIVPSE